MFQRSFKTSLLIATMMVVLNCFAWAEEAAKPAAAEPPAQPSGEAGA